MDNKIHDKKIIRRREYQRKSNYTKFKDILTEDFHGICGPPPQKQNNLLN